MELLSHREFAQLRLHQFEPKAIDRTETWIEFLDSRWLGESFETIEFLRREDDPHRLGLIGIGFEYVPSELASTILSALRLPVRRHMTRIEIAKALGEIVGTIEGEHGFIAHDFIAGAVDRYFIRCWFYKDEGLQGLDIVRGDLLSNHHAA